MFNINVVIQLGFPRQVMDTTRSADGCFQAVVLSGCVNDYYGDT